MGEPMALNLASAGMALLVWNRSPGAGEKLQRGGRGVAATPEECLRRFGDRDPDAGE